jgi:hypothetical protein
MGLPLQRSARGEEHAISNLAAGGDIRSASRNELIASNFGTTSGCVRFQNALPRSLLKQIELENSKMRSLGSAVTIKLSQ